MDLTFIINNADLLLILFAPLFFGCIFVEWYLTEKKNTLPDNSRYTKNETLCNMILAVMHQGSDIFAGLFISYLYLSVFDWRLFSVEINLVNFVMLIVAQDFCYYWFHRCSHRIRYMWAAHVVHHSSETMNFSTAFRQSLMYPIAGMWIFWLPLVIIGFPPNMVVLVVLFNLALQFFVHTQAIKSLGPLEYLFNSPSHHRVHHGKNPKYIDKNYAGVLIIWDKIFGTFEPEDETVVYGITKPVNSFNPITVTFAEWKDLYHDVSLKGLTIKQRLSILFRPPQ